MYAIRSYYAPALALASIVDDKLGTLWNMVGFQTKLKHGEQIRLFRTIPGLVITSYSIHYTKLYDFLMM